MTTGIFLVYSKCSNTLIEKGKCHVNRYVHLPKSDPDASRASHWADYDFGYRSNYWFRLDANRPSYRPSGVENTGLALESFRLPMSSLNFGTQDESSICHYVQRGKR
jgi:hypothetical protein